MGVGGPVAVKPVYKDTTHGGWGGPVAVKPVYKDTTHGCVCVCGGGGGAVAVKPVIKTPVHNDHSLLTSEHPCSQRYTIHMTLNQAL
jgi:hypothetical protein